MAPCCSSCAIRSRRSFRPMSRKPAAIGNLYAAGLRGWQTSALRDGCFQRVRCLPEKLHLPMDIAAHANGLRVTFNEPLERRQL
jgi:hypothetical protein